MPLSVEEFQPVANSGRVSGQDGVSNPSTRLVVLVLCIQKFTAKTHSQVVCSCPGKVKVNPFNAGVSGIFSGYGTRTLGRTSYLQARVVIEENRASQTQIAGQICFVA